MKRLSKSISAAMHRARASNCAACARAFGMFADETPAGDERDFANLAGRAALCLREYHSLFADLIEIAERDPEFRDALDALDACRQGTPEPLPLFEGVIE